MWGGGHCSCAQAQAVFPTRISNLVPLLLPQSSLSFLLIRITTSTSQQQNTPTLFVIISPVLPAPLSFLRAISLPHASSALR